MKIIKVIWELIKCFGRWMNTNATKRWLLALDRFSISFMFLILFTLGREAVEENVGFTNRDLVALGVYLLFLVCYVPSYMFPGSDKPVDGPPADYIDSLPVGTKKEP